MPRLLRQKVTGSLFIWTSALAELKDMEEVIEDPIKKIVEEVGVEDEFTDFKEVKATPLVETKIDEVT